VDSVVVVPLTTTMVPRWISSPSLRSGDCPQPPREEEKGRSRRIMWRRRRISAVASRRRRCAQTPVFEERERPKERGGGDKQLAWRQRGEEAENERETYQALAWSCRSTVGGVEDGRGGRREGTNPHPELLVHRRSQRRDE